jgi:hypothetical protein
MASSARSLSDLAPPGAGCAAAADVAMARRGAATANRDSSCCAMRSTLRLPPILTVLAQEKCLTLTLSNTARDVLKSNNACRKTMPYLSRAAVEHRVSEPGHMFRRTKQAAAKAMHRHSHRRAVVRLSAARLSKVLTLNSKSQQGMAGFFCHWHRSVTPSPRNLSHGLQLLRRGSGLPSSGIMLTHSAGVTQSGAPERVALASHAPNVVTAHVTSDTFQPAPGDVVIAPDSSTAFMVRRHCTMPVVKHCPLL